MNVPAASIICFVLTLIATLCNLVLVVLILRKAPPRHPGRLFAWFVLWTALWSLCCTVTLVAGHDLALWCSRATFFCAVFMTVSWIWFCTYFPHPSAKFRPIAWVLTFLTLPLSFLPWTALFIQDMSAPPWWAHCVLGPMVGPFGLWTEAITVSGAVLLAWKVRHERGLARLQIYYILVGFAGLVVMGGAFNFFIPAITGSTQLAPLGPVAALFVTVTTTYAILRYRLMDITVVVRAGLIYSLTIGILSTAYAFLMPAIANVIARLLAIPRQSVSFYLSLLLLILFYPVLRMLRGIVDKRFFRTVYDERQILRETSQAFAAARETPVLIEIIRQAIEHTLMPREIAVFLPDSDGVLSRMEHGGSWDLLPGLLPDSEPLLAFAVQQDDVLITEDLLSLFGVECDIGQRLRSWGVQVALPLVAGKQLCGMIMLGAKRSRDQYSIDDAALLRIVSKQAATALDNAYHYETLRRVNTQLEQRVHVRTQQLAIANAQLERTNTALEAERAYLSAAVDILPIPIFFRSHSGEIIRYNKAYAELHAREGNEERHQLLDPATHLPLPLEQWPSFRALHGEIIRASELRMQLPDSREIPVYTHAGPIYAGDELVAAVVVVQDISALKAADRAKDEFLAVVSHELKTPLTCILAWTEVAQFETDQTIISKALSIIEDKALLQRHLLNDLLDVSRIVHNKLLLHPKPVDLWALACHAVGDFEHLAEEHQLVLQLQPPTTELPIIADSDRLAQVVFNLLVNAMKFTDAGGLITVSGRRDGAFAFLDITDTGRGIPVEMLPDIFFPFRQVQRIEPSGGLGLGLALVKGITELHHGRVTAASDGMGHGSTFTVAFPLATTAAVSESMQVSCHPVPSHRSWV